MKTYDQLTEAQKELALSKCVDLLLEAIVDGGIRFNDSLNGDGLQARIDTAWANMERLQTPWFIGEAIMETCREDITGMAQCDAEDALYPEKGERTIDGVASVELVAA